MYYSTPILKSVIVNRHLKHTIAYLFRKNRSGIFRFLISVFRDEQKEVSPEISESVPLLLAFGLISKKQYPVTKNKSSLNFISAVNFELTYKCNYACAHCLQLAMPKTGDGQLLGEKIFETVKIAKVLGLLKLGGVNFTGGEILGRREDLFEILQAVKRIGVGFRLNTNSWWARKKNFTISGKPFAGGRELIEYLRSLGCVSIAFSFDVRYNDKLSNAPDLIESIRICEEVEMNYELILTGVEYDKFDLIYEELLAELNLPYLSFANIQAPEMVDIGGASRLEYIYTDQNNIAGCRGKGFYRPEILHVDPYGRVRSCMYAMGLGNVGNLKEKSFPEMLNEFVGNPANEMFTDAELFETRYKKIIGLYQHIYKPIKHQCTKMVVLARYLEMKDANAEHTPEKVHRHIAKELNLLR